MVFEVSVGVGVLVSGELVSDELACSVSVCSRELGAVEVVISGVEGVSTLVVCASGVGVASALVVFTVLVASTFRSSVEVPVAAVDEVSIGALACTVV